MTIGAQYRFEHRNAEKIFHVSKAVLYERMNRESRSGYPLVGHYTEQNRSGGSAATTTSRQMEVIRCLLVLMGYATWERAGLVQEAFQIQGQLVQHLRDAGLTEPYSDARGQPLDWCPGLAPARR